jgi:hypothetical protein
MSLLKLMKRAKEQKEMLHKQEDILIRKIKNLEKLTKEHEKLKCSHDDLVQSYEKISIEQTSTSNVLSCVAQLEKENTMLKNTIEKLNIENLALQEKYDMLVCSHNKFMDSHIMLEMAHEVVLTNLKLYQPHLCTCTEIETILPCANNCCYQASQSSIELDILGISDISITQENKELKEEVGRLRRILTLLKGTCHAQLSHDNRDNMVKKLEKGTTVACKKPLQKNAKFPKKAKAHDKCLNHASTCSTKGSKQATLPNKRRCTRKCYQCHEKGHDIKSCPYIKDSGLTLERKRLTNHVANKKQGKKESCKIKNHICYTCRRKEHLCKDCPMSKYPKPTMSIHSYSLKRPKNDTCARKVISSPKTSTKAIWVPKY